MERPATSSPVPHSRSPVPALRARRECTAHVLVASSEVPDLKMRSPSEDPATAPRQRVCGRRDPCPCSALLGLGTRYNYDGSAMAVSSEDPLPVDAAAGLLDSGRATDRLQDGNCYDAPVNLARTDARPDTQGLASDTAVLPNPSGATRRTDSLGCG